MRYLLIFVFIISGLHKSKASELDTLLTNLESTMSKRQAFDEIRQIRINDLKRRLTQPNLSNENQYYLHIQLIDEFEPFNFDSTLHYLNINQQLIDKINNESFRIDNLLRIAQILASSGRYYEAREYLNKVNAYHLENTQLIGYYKIWIIVYSDLVIYSPINENQDKYWHKARTYTDSLKQVLSLKSEQYLALEEKKNRDNWRFRACEEINNKRLAQTAPGSRKYSMITFERSLIYELEGNTELRKKYLILSAISDIKAAVKDNASLTTLALLLHKEGDIDRAYNFIKFAYEDASFYNSRLRFTHISNILPVINEAYQVRANEQQRKLRNFLYIISVLLLFLVVAIYFIHRQLKSLNKAQSALLNVNNQLKQLNIDLKSTNENLNDLNKELSESNLVKEHYIANFLTICSNYIDKLDALNKGIGKQINAGKIEELLKQSKSRKLMDQEIKEFYQNFDDIFLHIYPHFVEEVNNLLEDDEELKPKNKEALNTELRVFALIRLGINDSSRIAKLLRYSVNTIYNYRVKIKNKAKGNRNEFEQNIMKIDAATS